MKRVDHDWSKLQQGDIVSTTYFVFSGPNQVMAGRLVAELDENSAFLLTGQQGSTTYVVQTGYKIDQPLPYHGPEWDHERFSAAWAEGKLGLRWGKIDPKFKNIARTAGLISQSFNKEMFEQHKKLGVCPRCGDLGEWRSLALVCRHGHGIFAG